MRREIANQTLMYALVSLLMLVIAPSMRML